MSENEPPKGYNLRSTPAVGRYYLRSAQGVKLLDGLDADSAASAKSHTSPTGARRIKPLRKRSQPTPPPAANPLYYIPGDISNSARAINDAEIALSFPLTALNRTQRLIWGLPDNSSSLFVRLKFSSPKDTTESTAESLSASTVGFCVYFLAADAQEPAGPHIYRYAGRPWTNSGLICNGRANILTYVAARELYLLFGGEKDEEQEFLVLQRVHEAISTLVADSVPASKCVICRNDLGVSLKMYRATTCSNEACRETFDGAPLSVRLSPFLLEPSALDFLLCTVYSVPEELRQTMGIFKSPQRVAKALVSGDAAAMRKAVASADTEEADELGCTTAPRPRRLPVPVGGIAEKHVGESSKDSTGDASASCPPSGTIPVVYGAKYWRDTLLPGCPIRWTDIQGTLDTFPVLQSVKSLSNLIDGPDQPRQHNDDSHAVDDDIEAPERRRRRMLISWLVNLFRGCMIPAPERTAIKGIPSAATYMMMNSAQEDYVAFSKKLRVTSAESALGGWAVFHGTPAGNVFNILRGGLRDTARRQRGNPPGRKPDPGIFCSDLIRYSLWYAKKKGSAIATWRNSRLGRNLAVVFGCELAQSKEPTFLNMEYSFADEESATLRYVFLLDPREPIWAPKPRLERCDNPPAEMTRPVMQDVYRQLHAGRLLGDA